MSIGYQVNGATEWRLYTTPIREQRFKAKAVRYGHRESDVVAFERP